MKKLFLLLILLFPWNCVKAETYYSDYSDWKQVDALPKLSEDLFETKEEKKYLWYRLKKEGKYFKVGEINEEYPIKREFFQYGEWSLWSNQKPKIVEGIEIDTRKVYYYRLMKQIQFIRISQLSSKELQLVNLHTYKNAKEIDFQQYEIGSDIILELAEPCYVDELEIEFTLVDITENEKHLQIEWLYDLESPSCMKSFFWYFFTGAYETTYRYRNLAENDIVWEEKKSSIERLENNIHRQVWVEEQYRYREQYQYYEKEKREYNDVYSNKSIDDYVYLDPTTEKNILYVRTRKRIDLKKQTIGPLENKDDSLKKQLEEANATIMTLQNENSKKKEEIINQYEKNLEVEEKGHKNVDIKKQSFDLSFFLLLFLIIVGLSIGRIVTIKKKF